MDLCREINKTEPKATTKIIGKLKFMVWSAAKNTVPNNPPKVAPSTPKIMVPKTEAVLGTSQIATVPVIIPNITQVIIIKVLHVPPALPASPILAPQPVVYIFLTQS